MTVQELIDVLSALPTEDKERVVGCTYDADCAWTGIHGIHDRLDVSEDGDPDPVRYLRLQGD